MADRSAIEWCDSTFNPWLGCTKVSPGCDHCYAEARLDTRLHVVGWGAGQPRKRTSAKNWRDPEKWNKDGYLRCTACNWRGERKDTVNFGDCPLCEGRVENARRRVFCASLADVFDNEVPPQWRGELWALVKATPNLDWLILTKRIGNARGMAPADGFPPNVWLGATIVNQEEADRDIPKLLATPAAVRFLSMEPLLGPVDLTNVAPPVVEGRTWHGIDAITPANRELRGCVDWVIVGGESGHHARPMHPDWPRSLRDQCAAAGVPFLFKQWGEWRPISEMEDADYNPLYRSRVKAREGQDQGALDDSYGRVCTVPDGIIHADGSLHDVVAPMAFQQGTGAMQTFRVGKKAAGRLLDGRTHDGFPDGVPVTPQAADAETKAAYVAAFGHDEGWLDIQGSYFIEGYRAGKGEGNG